MLFIIVTTLHVIAALVLVIFILLHAGRGGGLSDMFGGGMSLGGSTVAEKNLDRLTVFAAALFTVTTISLGFLIKEKDAVPDPAPVPTSSIPAPSGSPIPGLTGSPIPGGTDAPTGGPTGGPTGARTPTSATTP